MVNDGTNSQRQHQPAVFLDRDGTLIRSVD